MNETKPKVLIFDLGMVLIKWDPVPAIANGVGKERAMKFLNDPEFQWFKRWNKKLDSGATLESQEQEAIAQFPHYTEEILSYRRNFPLSLIGEVEGTSNLLFELQNKIPLFALTNWPGELFHYARERFPALSVFSDIVISGEVKCSKPEPEIFRILKQRIGNNYTFEECLFIDDNLENVIGARKCGLPSYQFTDSKTLRSLLMKYEILN